MGEMDDDGISLLQQQLREKELRLTDVQLEALSSAHRLQQMQDVMKRLKVSTVIVTKIINTNLTYKRRYVCLSVCMRAMAGQTARPIKTKLGMGTHVDPGSVLGKVKVMWRHLANANKTPYRGTQGPREFEREAR